MSSASVPAPVLLYTAKRWGTVASAMAHGTIRNAVKAHSAQMFSHFHRTVYFVGAAKLPFNRPATNARTMPAAAVMLPSRFSTRRGLDIHRGPENRVRSDKPDRR